MTKKDFYKLRPEYKKEDSIGDRKVNSLTQLPKGVIIVEDINEFIGYDQRAEADIVYFTKNIKGEYYIELTTKDTNLNELEQYIKLKLVFK